jgi:hypothetical protein
MYIELAKNLRSAISPGAPSAANNLPQLTIPAALFSRIRND